MDQQFDSPHYDAASEPRTVTQYFIGEPPPVRLPLGYGFGLALVLVATIALPLLYLGLIGLAAFAIYLYAVHGAGVFFPEIGGARRVSLGLALLYFAPIAAGIIFVFFMLKPIFSGFGFRRLTMPVGHVENPELFRFIGQLCQMLGVPIPSRVDVELAVNASAGFRAGFSSLFGNDIMLTIGLPLVAGLNCREFAGVLAHELGHFRQRTAMRFGFVINSINGWFFRAVYQRDQHDQWLSDEGTQSGFIMIAFMLARIAIAFTRGILWVFMMCGHALSSFLSRQMEFHADACALAVAGTDSFLALRHKLRMLDFSAAQISAQMKRRTQPKFPDDLSTYIAVMASQCAGEIQGKVARVASKHKARWFDTHPSDAARSERARQANLPGLIHDLRPATSLFGDFSRVSQELTSKAYSFFRRPLRRDQIFHVEVPKDIVPDTTEQEAAIKNFLGGIGLVIKPLLFETGPGVTVGIVSERGERLRQAKALMATADLLSMREALKATDTALLAALQQQALLQAGCFSDPSETPADPAAAIAQLNGDWIRLSAEIHPFEEAAKDRLLIALGLLRTPAVAAKLHGTQALHDEVKDLLHVFGALSAAFPALLALRQQFAKLQALLPHRVPGAPELLDAVLRNEAGEAARLIGQVQQALGATAYPFSHVKGQLPVADFARAKEYDPDSITMTCNETESHLQTLFALYFQLLGRLVAISSQVEAHLGTNAMSEVPAGSPLRIIRNS